MSFKNSLESCIFNMKAVVEDENLQGKINNKDEQKILDKCEIVIWVDKDQNAEKKEFEQKEFELFIRRKSWKMSPALSLSSCTRVQEACQEEYLGARLVVEFLHLVMPLLDPPL